MPARSALAAGLVALTVGCTGGEKPATVRAADAAPAGARPAAPGGATVTGEVKFVGTVPANPLIDMREEPKCQADYQTKPHEEIVAANGNGTLANVFVYVQSGLPADAKYTTPAAPVVIEQKG